MNRLLALLILGALLIGCVQNASRDKTAPVSSCGICDWFNGLRASADAARPAERWSEISVTVTDESGHPLENIKTYVYDSESKRPILLKFTNKQGQAYFETGIEKSHAVAIQAQPGPDYLPQFLDPIDARAVRMALVATGLRPSKSITPGPPEYAIAVHSLIRLPNQHLLRIHDYPLDPTETGYEISEYAKNGIHLSVGKITPEQPFVGIGYSVSMQPRESGNNPPQFNLHWAPAVVPAGRACVLFRQKTDTGEAVLSGQAREPNAAKDAVNCLDHFNSEVVTKAGCGSSGTYRAFIALMDPKRAESIRNPFEELTPDEFVFYYFCSSNNAFGTQSERGIAT